jgi:hypothetical protein
MLTKMFSRPVISGWKPVPTSSRLAIHPRAIMVPVVGEVTLLRIFSSVLFLAPAPYDFCLFPFVFYLVFSLFSYFFLMAIVICYVLKAWSMEHGAWRKRHRA